MSLSALDAGSETFVRPTGSFPKPKRGPLGEKPPPGVPAPLGEVAVGKDWQDPRTLAACEPAASPAELETQTSISRVAAPVWVTGR